MFNIAVKPIVVGCNPGFLLMERADGVPVENML